MSMMGSPAAAAKERVKTNLFHFLQFILSITHQGNAAFKAGDHPAAVGHYTAAILANPLDITFYLNRAAAYLKLSKSVPHLSAMPL
jgi:hypothetical protein